MPSKIIHGLIISMTIIALLFATVIISFAENTTYIYDELNRLIRVEYGDGSYIEYIYDKAGNRRYLGPEDLTPPVTTALPAGGIYNNPQSVTLICNDGVGSGCDKIYYTTDGTTPTTSSPVYSSPINISTVGTNTLQFFGIDFAGNSETAKTEIYTIVGYIRIGGTAYSSLQAAYDAANTGDTIKCRDLTFIQNLIVNRNITITLEGGYDSEFTTNYGTMTIIKGMIQTTSGGGTITIKNFTLQSN